MHDLAEQLPRLALEVLKLHRLDRVIVGRTGRDSDARQNHRDAELLKVRRLLHDIGARKLVAATPQGLGHQERHGVAVDVAKISQVRRRIAAADAPPRNIRLPVFIFPPEAELFDSCGKPTRLRTNAKPLPSELPPHPRHNLKLTLMVTGEAQHQVAGAGVGIRISARRPRVPSDDAAVR